MNSPHNKNSFKHILSDKVNVFIGNLKLNILPGYLKPGGRLRERHYCHLQAFLLVAGKNPQATKPYNITQMQMLQT